MFGKRATILLLIAAALVFLMAGAAAAQAGYSGAPPSSIGQPLMREGDFAVKLVQALSLGTTRDEVEAENLLTQAGIMPKNGWMADYPMTPDIIGEIRATVHDAASSGKLNAGADTALTRVDDVLAQGGLPVSPDTESAQAEAADTAEAPAAPEYTGSAPEYPSTTVINNYYETEGPPTVTYYAPPPAYSYLYGWVSYPFWCSGVWFPGFFVLHDFHRTVFVDNRTVFVSNHFRDGTHHRFMRIDPVSRVRGNSFAGVRSTAGTMRGARTDGTFVRSGTGTFTRSATGTVTRSMPARAARDDFRTRSAGRQVSVPSPGGSVSAAPAARVAAPSRSPAWSGGIGTTRGVRTEQSGGSHGVFHGTRFFGVSRSEAATAPPAASRGFSSAPFRSSAPSSQFRTGSPGGSFSRSIGSMGSRGGSMGSVGSMGSRGGSMGSAGGMGSRRR